MESRDHPSLSALSAAVYATEAPYTAAELTDHHRVFPEGQFVAVHDGTGAVAGAHFTLILQLRAFHIDDPWDVVTAGGRFTDHDPVNGHTLYGADLMVHPQHQHHGLGRALTEAARWLTRERRLWRMAGGSRMPGYGHVAARLSAPEYVVRVRRGELVDPVLTAHIHDGWDPVTAIRGYLPHDVESAGWAAVIQWLNPAVSVPPGMEIERLPRRA